VKFVLVYLMTFPALAATQSVFLEKLPTGEVIIYNEQHTVKSKIKYKEFSHYPARDNAPYRPSIIVGLHRTTDIFNNFKRNYNDDLNHAHHRAHVWAYEEMMRSGIKMMKTFIFFSDQFILNNNLKWWYTVAPSVVVNEDGLLQQRVLDPVIANRPILIKEWIYELGYSYPCTTIKSYSEYQREQAHSSANCYVLHESMYHYSPVDLEEKDKTQLSRISFSQKEIDQSYKTAFE
jgi:hypothetical protein